MACLRKCIERANVRVVFGCPHETPHPPHDWFRSKSGRYVHCHGMEQS